MKRQEQLVRLKVETVEDLKRLREQMGMGIEGRIDHIEMVLALLTGKRREEKNLFSWIFKKRRDQVQPKMETP